MFQMSDRDVENVSTRIQQIRDCWIWRGNVSGTQCFPSMYNSFYEQSFMVNRALYALFKEVDIYSFGCLYRECKNHLCVNPAHMTELRKPNKLVEDSIQKEIIDKYYNKSHERTTYNDLSVEYNLSYSVIRKIIKRIIPYNYELK